MTRKSKKKSSWRGGSFQAAVGGYLKKKVKKAAGSVWKRFKKDSLGSKSKRKKQ